jgi:hypothetical protein
MKKLTLACILAVAAALPTVTYAVDAPASAPAHASTSETLLGDILDDPKMRAILDKYLPALSSAEQIDMARGMTLRDVQQYAPDTVTDDALAKIDADLAKLPAK